MKQTEAIALFVSLNGCSLQQKAGVALEIRQNLTTRLELRLLYPNNPYPNLTSFDEPDDGFGSQFGLYPDGT